MPAVLFYYHDQYWVYLSQVPRLTILSDNLYKDNFRQDLNPQLSKTGFPFLCGWAIIWSSKGLKRIKMYRMKDWTQVVQADSSSPLPGIFPLAGVPALSTLLSAFLNLRLEDSKLWGFSALITRWPNFLQYMYTLVVLFLCKTCSIYFISTYSFQITRTTWSPELQ